ncbi:MAG: ABC transporter permease, partial [Gammaproteobacteria bacterium]|nr:ABC transporter permease [Gammaproteobacteria bacterium]
STTIGMGIMVASFRSTVEDWLHWTLQADIYVSAPHSISSRSDGTLDTKVLALVESLPGIREISSGRRTKVETEQGPIDLLALSMASRSYRGFHFKEQSLPDIWRKFRDGDAILVSEPYAYHQRLSVGSRIGLFTAEGLQYFLVGGVFYDYGSDRGMLVMNRQVYQRLWRDSEISALGVYLEPGVNTTYTLQAINQALAGVDQQLLIRSNGEIRSSSLKIFDRTFTVTQVLRLLAVGVAFIGIFNALLALLLERAKEHAVLRAIGVTPRQLLGLVSLQAGLMGFLAGLLALPLGWVMSRILIQVINLRSFGWTIQPLIPSGVLLEAMLLSLLAALLAAIYPAWKITRVQPAAALREE